MTGVALLLRPSLSSKLAMNSLTQSKPASPFSRLSITSASSSLSSSASEKSLIDREVLVGIPVIATVAFIVSLYGRIIATLALHIADVSENSSFLDLIAFFCDGILFGDIEFLQRVITRGDQVLYKELSIPIAKTGIKGLIPNHGVLVSSHLYLCMVFACYSDKNTKKVQIVQLFCTIFSFRKNINNQDNAHF